MGQDRQETKPRRRWLLRKAGSGGGQVGPGQPAGPAVLRALSLAHDRRTIYGGHRPGRRHGPGVLPAGALAIYLIQALFRAYALPGRDDDAAGRGPIRPIAMCAE